MDYVYALLIIGSAAVLSWPLGLCLKEAMDPASECRRDGMLKVFLGASAVQAVSVKRYIGQMLFFNLLMFAISATLLFLQPYLPLNPDGKGPLAWDLIFNTAASFTTNTNLQHYSGEVSMSYGSQLWSLMWLQFVSAATGLAAVTALSRLAAGRKVAGNFYMDVTRATMFVLLPLSFFVAFAFIFFGMPMTFLGAETVRTLEGASQIIARGPVAAFIAIKQVGTNGGGFFGPNATHPFENPTVWTGSLQMIAMLIVPMACVWMFGRIVKKISHALVIFSLMTGLLVTQSFAAIYLENQTPAVFTDKNDIVPSPNMEGKEVRFGTATSPLWAALTTSTSTGAVVSMHNSFQPLTLVVPFIGMWFNVIVGGVGVGFINFYLFIIIGVFISGLMVGRTPEYLGRKVETAEMKWASLAILLHPLLILGSTAVFVSAPWGTSAVKNPGHRGFSEILYEFSSAAANNGSGLEGLGDGTVPWNIATGLVMLIARFLPMILPLLIAGSLAQKNQIAESPGTLSVENWPFALVVLSTILLVGALLFMPVAVVGPIAEFLEVAYVR